MKTQLAVWVLGLLLLAPSVSFADETITVTATDSDISANLDLKAVATLFGEAKNLEEFEQQLNDPESRISNLDLNGDGVVDYLRVVETTDKNAHLVVIQAVLAKDIYQDVASIYVEKDEVTKQVTVQIIGDEYIYGTNYVIEPVYIYTPVIYDWFWGAHWYCWHSPYYWGYYPGYWHAYDCWLVHDYWHHIYDYHHHHPYCSYRMPPKPAPAYAAMRPRVARYDYATLYPDRAFAQRNASRGGVHNARDLQPQRAGRDVTSARRTESAAQSRTFGSRYANDATHLSGATGSSRVASSDNVSRRGVSSATQGIRTQTDGTSSNRQTITSSASRSATTSSGSRTATANSSGSRATTSTGSNSRNTAVSRASSSSVSRSSIQSATRSSTTSVSRGSSSSISRGASVSSGTRSSSSSRVGSSYSGGSSRSSGSFSGGGRSGGSSSRSGGGSRR